MAGPRRFNWFTVVTLLLFGAGSYWLWKFFPVYMTAWQVDQELSAAAASCYKISMLNEPLRTKTETELVNKLRVKIASMGVTDPELAVSLEYAGKNAIVHADYRVVVKHSGVNQQSILVMHRRGIADVSKVNWD